jgi:hypothetical protein
VLFAVSSWPSNCNKQLHLHARAYLDPSFSGKPPGVTPLQDQVPPSTAVKGVLMPGKRPLFPPPPPPAVAVTAPLPPVAVAVAPPPAEGYASLIGADGSLPPGFVRGIVMSNIVVAVHVSDIFDSIKEAFPLAFFFSNVCLIAPYYLHRIFCLQYV